MSEEHYDIDPLLIAAFADEAEESLSEAQNAVIALERDPRNRSCVDSVFRVFHTIKGNSAFFGLMRIKALAHEAEDVMVPLRNGEACCTKEAAAVFLRTIDLLRQAFSEIRSTHGDAGVAAQADLLCVDLRALSAVFKGKKVSTIPQPAVSAVSAETTSKTEQAETGGRAASPDAERAAKSLRVQESVIDDFFKVVGEILVIREMYSHVLKRLRDAFGNEPGVMSLSKVNAAFFELSNTLQQSVLEIRKVPVKSLFSKFPRIVKDTADIVGKDIELITVGESLTIDKSIAEKVEAPLMHLLRNAVDHGIELPGERTEKGKSARGSITLSVSETDTGIVFSVVDDGKGLVRSVIEAKAISGGFADPIKIKSCDDAAVFACLFEPGFSTAKAVTDISGRGVGLDVVKQNVLALGGTVTLASRPGNGCTFTLTLPKTVAVNILRGMVLRSGGKKFVFPVKNVGETFAVIPADIISVAGKGEGVNRHGVFMPILRFSRFAGIENIEAESVAVSVNIGKTCKAVLVDEVISLQHVVVKDLRSLAGVPDYVTGAAMLGDESMAVVVDPELLCG